MIESPRPDGSARLDDRGRLLEGDRWLFDLATAGDSVPLPKAHRHAWSVVPDRQVIWQVSPEGQEWRLAGFLGPGEPLAWDDLGRVDRANYLSVTRSTTLNDTVRELCTHFWEESGLLSPTVVLIDPSGDPTFAGGMAVFHEQLAAMERTRRNGAPMVIWQAFDERRIIVDPTWFATAKLDDRFVPIRSLFVEDIDATYLAIPMTVDDRTIGVLSGVWNSPEPVTPARIRRWWMLTERLTLALRYSEAIRRSRAQGAEATRAKLHDDLHATLAQDVFVLSLEVARIGAADAAGGRDDLEATRALTDRLVADIRAFIDDPRDHGGIGLTARLEELADDIRARSGARVTISPEIDWDLFSSSFADDLARILAEAFRNILKHASPTAVLVSGSIDADSRRLRLVVTDDGHDRPVPASPGTGVGLALLRRLVEDRDGELTVEVSESGSRLTVVVVPEYESEWAVAQKSLEGYESPI